jgi:AraC family transcriptional regulator
LPFYNNFEEVRPMENKNPIFRSLEIIENRITKKLTVENIAADIYISKHYYMRLFRELVGDSVMEYVIRRKLTLVGKVLLSTQTSILDIALDFGYACV